MKKAITVITSNLIMISNSIQFNKEDYIHLFERKINENDFSIEKDLDYNFVEITFKNVDIMKIALAIFEAIDYEIKPIAWRSIF